MSLVGLALATVASGITLLASARMTRKGSPRTGSLGKRLGDSLLSVQSTPWAAGETVELSRFDDVEKLAKMHGCMVLHESRPGVDAYFVRSGDVTYRLQGPVELEAQHGPVIPRRAA